MKICGHVKSLINKHASILLYQLFKLTIVVALPSNAEWVASYCQDTEGRNLNCWIEQSVLLLYCVKTHVQLLQARKRSLSKILAVKLSKFVSAQIQLL